EARPPQSSMLRPAKTKVSFQTRAALTSRSPAVQRSPSCLGAPSYPCPEAAPDYRMPPTIRAAGRISVVVPALNEAEKLPQLLVALDREPELREIIVADGGSNDGTPVIARQLGASVILTGGGRGGGLRAGAAAASGEILLFLHADSVFPIGGLSAIAAALD